MGKIQKLALFAFVTVGMVIVGALPSAACSINAAGSCGGSACPKGEICYKTGDLECECVWTNKPTGRSEAGECARANAVLSELLGSSSEEIRLQAALGLLDHGCTDVGLQVAPGCVEPADKQYKACRAACEKNSPGLQECLDGCTDVFGAVLERCAEGPNIQRNDCHDCLSDCSEGIYQCKLDCRNQEPWDPDCYDDCDEDCSETCKDECS